MRHRHGRRRNNRPDGRQGRRRHASQTKTDRKRRRSAYVFLNGYGERGNGHRPRRAVRINVPPTPSPTGMPAAQRASPATQRRRTLPCASYLQRKRLSAMDTLHYSARAERALSYISAFGMRPRCEPAAAPTWIASLRIPIVSCRPSPTPPGERLGSVILHGYIRTPYTMTYRQATVLGCDATPCAQSAPQRRLRCLPDSLRAATDPAMAQRRPDAARRGTGALDSL